MTVRPTLRCMRDDLCVALPTVDVPLNEIDHPVVRKANEQFAQPTGRASAYAASTTSWPSR
jgi:hypothetical protein